MFLRNPHKFNEIKQFLFEKLKHECVFWSYDVGAFSLSNLPDDQLIAMTLRHLDLAEIDQLFLIYPWAKIKSAWKRILVPEGDFLYTLNRFIAWYYFKAKRPDAYLKSLQTRHLHSLLN